MTESRGRFLPLSEVTAETSLSKSSLRRHELAGDFPKRVRLSKNRSGWWSEDIDCWKEKRRQAPPS